MGNLAWDISDFVRQEWSQSLEDMWKVSRFWGKELCLTTLITEGKFAPQNYEDCGDHDGCRLTLTKCGHDKTHDNQFIPRGDPHDSTVFYVELKWSPMPNKHLCLTRMLDDSVGLDYCEGKTSQQWRWQYPFGKPNE